MKKKTTLLLLSLCLILSITACGKKKEDPDNSTHNVDVQTEQEIEEKEENPGNFTQEELDGTVPADDKVEGEIVTKEEEIEEYLNSEDVLSLEDEISNNMKTVKGKCLSYTKLENATGEELGVYYICDINENGDFEEGFYIQPKLEFTMDGEKLEQEINYASPNLEGVVYDFVLVNAAGDVYCISDQVVNSETYDVTFRVLPISTYEKAFN